MKYCKLEEDVIEQRGKARDQITKFMENEVGLKLANANNHRLRIEARLKHGNQVSTATR